MRSRSNPPRIIAALLLAALAVPASAQTTPPSQTTPPAQTPSVRKDRVFLKDVEGIWINETYLSVLAALKSPHAAAKKTPPVVIAIRREGRAYPIVITDFHRASLQAVLDLEPDGKPALDRLVAQCDDVDVDQRSHNRLRRKERIGKTQPVRIAEPDFMQGKWAENVTIAGELSPQLNRFVIARSYRDEKGQTWKFSESGEATWPGQKFNYELSLNDPGANCDYLQVESADKGANDKKGADDKKRYGYGWKGGKLSIFTARLAGNKVVCDAKPLAVLAPQ
jgi:hypothetical protein